MTDRIDGRWILFDWGGTLMVDAPGLEGPMASWPHVEAVPNAVETLGALRARGWSIALATNAEESGEADIRAALDRVGLSRPIDRVFCYRGVGHRKPSPEFFAHVARDLDVDPSDLVMVGDDYATDVVGANAAGIPAVLLSTGSPVQRGPGMYAVIGDLSQLPLLLDTWPDAGATVLWALGFSPRWQALFSPYDTADVESARVVRTDRGSSLVATAGGIRRAETAVSLVKGGREGCAVPAVGDWVAVRTASDLEVPLIEAVLDRASAITRGDPGEASAIQVLAANVDTVFITHPIADPPNLRRLERELSLAWDSGAVPVVVLTKADLSADADAARAEVESIAFGTDVLLTSARSGMGIDDIRERVARETTAVFIGPSGAGKSSLINALLGEERQATREVRLGDGAGRHTTVARELLQLPGGGLLIDTPGLRSLGLTGSDAGIASAFPEIERLAQSCRFRDCAHMDEPGCAVRAAVVSGELPVERLDSYHKLLGEAEVAATKTDARLRAEEARKGRIFSKVVKEYHKRYGRE